MTKNAASESALGALHSKVADVMSKTLDVYSGMHEEYVKKKDDGEEVIYTEPSAAFLGAVTKFLKDNSVTCSVDDSSSLSELEKRLMAKKTGRNVVQLRDISIA